MSYSHADESFALALVDELERLDVGVWIDKVELFIGDSLIEKIGSAISESDFLVAVISPHSVNSPWCRKELAIAATQGIHEKRVKVLPIRLGDVDMPSFQADAVWGDAAVHTPEGLAGELVAAMRHHLDLRRGLPMLSPTSNGADVSGHGRPASRPVESGRPQDGGAGAPWSIVSGGATVPSGGRDADGFAWRLRRDDETRTMVVWISGSVMASRDAGLTPEVGQAKRTRGRSVVEQLLRQPTIPAEVLVSTYGVRFERTDAGSDDELSTAAEARSDVADDKRSPGGRPRGAARVGLLKELLDLLLVSKDAARTALEEKQGRGIPALVNIGIKMDTVLSQLGDQEWPSALGNLVGNVQDPSMVMSFWRAAVAEIKRMIVAATE